jgi:non-specific serine/threonine protein kinase
VAPVLVRRTWPATRTETLRQASSASVPSEVNAFVGRERDLVRLRELLAQTRLLSLVGPGGVGKTRLAIRLVAEVRDAFPDGAWFVDLSHVADAALVPQAVADAFDIQQQPGQSWLSELSRLLSPHRILLVLDNCEHLVPTCAEFVDGLLRSCPELRVVVTSLQPLGTSGETIWRVPPLPIPGPFAHELGQLNSSEAVRLFVKRVQAHLPDFALTAANAQAVSEICRRLDGLPLALELVAARVESLGVAEVAQRIRDRFALAVSAAGRGPERQQTLQSALDWSCSLLSSRELVLLRRLSVFVGGWTLQAAEVVCADEILTAETMADTLGQLVTKSLVVVDHDGMRVRYRLLETVRAYASMQLDAAAEAEAIQLQHATFMVNLAARHDFDWMDLARHTPVAAEEDNLRAALDWAIQHERAQLAVQLTSAAFPVWLVEGHYFEGSGWLERILSMPAALSSEHRSAAMARAGRLRLILGDYRGAESLGQDVLQAHQARGDSLGIALALDLLGRVAQQRGNLARCGALQAEVVRRMREHNSPRLALSLMELGVVQSEIGDDDQLRRLIEEIEAIGHERGEPILAAAGLHLRALIAIHEGRQAMAADLLEQELEIRRPAGGQQGIIKALTIIGHVRLEQGQSRAASAALMEAVERARTSGELIRLLRALEGCARCVVNSDADAAVRLAGATERQRQALGAVPWPSERRYLNKWQARARETLGPGAYQRAWQDGLASTLDQAINLARAASVEPEPVSTAASELTPREQEVALLVAQGLTNKQIASELTLSPATVRTHVEHVLNKLDLRTRAQIAVWAAQHGLVPGAPSA